MYRHFLLLSFSLCFLTSKAHAMDDQQTGATQRPVTAASAAATPTIEERLQEVREEIARLNTQWRSAPPARRAEHHARLQAAQARLTQLESGHREGDAPLSLAGQAALRRLQAARQQAATAPSAAISSNLRNDNTPPLSPSPERSPSLPTPGSTLIQANAPALRIGIFQVYRDIYSDGSMGEMKLQNPDGTFRPTTMEEVMQLARRGS